MSMEAQRSQIGLKRLYQQPLEAEIFNVAATLKVLAYTSFEVSSSTSKGSKD